jgi:hypothetical protein
MVDYLNSLRTQQQESNATYVHETRHEFVRDLQRGASWFPEESQLHVSTLLDQLASDLAEGGVELRLLFLTGDAGDGKTAFCAELARLLGHQGELRWQTDIGPFCIIKDASEVEEGILSERIMSQLNSGPSRTLVVAINEGRLRRVFRALSGSAHQLWMDVIEPSLETWINEARAETLDDAMRKAKVMVINFRHRFHIRSVTPALLSIWTDAKQWEGSPACSTCPKNESCPILANVVDLRTESVRERISDVLAWSHFSGQRLPFRRLQAVLALATTGGLRCENVQDDTLGNQSSLGLLRYRYYNALFLRGDERGPIVVRPEPIAQTFAGADPGQFVSPERDAQIQCFLDPSLEGVPGENEAMLWKLPALEQKAIGELQRRLDPSSGGEDVAALQDDIARVMRNLRRQAQFITDVPRGLDWRDALHLLEGHAAGRATERKLARMVVEAINRLHRVEEVKSETITGNQIDPAGLRVPARQVLELNFGTEFEVNVDCGPILPRILRPYLESVPSEIYLQAWPVGQKMVEPARIRLGAHLVDSLLAVLRGYSGWHGFGPYRRDLARFHGRLMALAIESAKSAAVTIRVGDKRYGVTVDQGEGRAQLRFEGQG